MKNDRHGKAKILTQSEIQLLFSQGFQEDRDRALFEICLFSACRIREACTLRVADAHDASARVVFENISGIVSSTALGAWSKVIEAKQAWKGEDTQPARNSVTFC